MTNTPATEEETMGELTGKVALVTGGSRGSARRSPGGWRSGARRWR
ncbi:hypothetical protein [Kitasatospora sp. NPDC085464]